MKLTRSELKQFLDEKAELYNRPSFIESDPISIPHRFTRKEDIEIAGFLAASISWGNRKMILRNCDRMMQLMDNDPFDFIINAGGCDIARFEKFVHRTFNHMDLLYFIEALRNIYLNRGGMEKIFSEQRNDDSLQPSIHQFVTIFFELPHLKRTERQVPDPFKGSASKKINMFLRWMVRKDDRGVDFGIWKSIPPSVLSCPLDIHSGNVARALGLLTRKQNDAKAVAELDGRLRELDPSDPVKYDYALFGLGAIEKFV